MTPSHIRRISLTGGIASGKSLVGDYLQRKGIPVIDADQVVHTLLRSDTALQAQIRQAFGDECLNDDGSVNRAQVGSVVFGDVDKRRQLEQWIHPKVRQAMNVFYETQQAAGQSIGVALIPLLFESRLQDLYDEIWLIQTTEALQQQRLAEHRSMEDDAALARIQSQMPFEDKHTALRKHPCGHLLMNTGSPEALYQQVDDLLAIPHPWIASRHKHPNS
jgi:dephospho-CoA kinase